MSCCLLILLSSQIDYKLAYEVSKRIHILQTKSLTKVPGLVDYYRQALDQFTSNHEVIKPSDRRGEGINSEANGVKTTITNKGKMVSC